MRPWASRWGLLLLLSIGLGGCEYEFEPPDREARVLAALADYRLQDFDSIEWVSTEGRLRTGNEVYATKCRRCHGTVGEGATEYARGRGLTVPSLVREDWPYTEFDYLRRRVFGGYVDGMPIWGEGGISLREIDAAAYYVFFQLRPELEVDGGR